MSAFFATEFMTHHREAVSAQSLAPIRKQSCGLPQDCLFYIMSGVNVTDITIVFSRHIADITDQVLHIGTA